MAEVKYTLVSEGPTDQALMPLIDWIFKAQRSDLAVNSEWANTYLLPSKPKGMLAEIRSGLEFFPCDVLFVHRDSDNDSPDKRRSEIEEAVASLKERHPPYICVIPVRETEAWFLFDEKAIREFVGNPEGKADLNLPKQNKIEEVRDAKLKLEQALEAASKTKGRRKKSYSNTESLIALALSIETYEPLRQLSAFSRLEADIQAYLETLTE